MKEHGILFKTQMVKAIDEGNKNMTRRLIVKRNSSCTVPLNELDFNDVVLDGYNSNYGYLKVSRPLDDTRHRVFCKYEVGDLIYAKETYQYIDFAGEENNGYVYKATENGQDWAENSEEWKWKPSLFMPKKAARIWLEITSIRPERLQDISEGDAISEGIDLSRTSGDFESTPRWIFRQLWESINGTESWEINPWVWVISFKRIVPNLIYFKKREDEYHKSVMDIIPK